MGKTTKLEEMTGADIKAYRTRKGVGLRAFWERGAKVAASMGSLVENGKRELKGRVKEAVVSYMYGLDTENIKDLGKAAALLEKHDLLKEVRYVKQGR